ncbi:unnamed protein product [Leptidea sinapis]|uniref:Uncharacterized protein n=1 Tax=Leptidea sinapis TaxID=189913 RepID=A0A5E4R2F0_9NEOP|nr:unnamed protein product [Leptidea sinapis]
MCIRISVVNPYEFGKVKKIAVVEIRSRNQRRTSPRKCRSPAPARSHEASRGFARPKCGVALMRRIGDEVARWPGVSVSVRISRSSRFGCVCECECPCAAVCVGYLRASGNVCCVGTMREQEGDGPESR